MDEDKLYDHYTDTFSQQKEYIAKRDRLTICLLLSLVAFAMLDLRLKQIELARKEKESEESKMASVEVNVVETARKQANKLRFYNKGKAIARNIRFNIPSDDEANGIQLHMPNDYLPYPQLLPLHSFDIPYLDLSDSPHQTIVITWEDDFSKDRKVEMVVDM